jgi:hypothetical protein
MVVYNTESLRLWTLSMVSETGSVSVFRRKETPTLLCLLEIANLNHWITEKDTYTVGSLTKS